MIARTLMKPNKDLSSSTSSSKGWLRRLKKIIEKDPVNPNWNNKTLAEKMEISERDLFRKVKKLTGLSPQKYLKQFRLQQAMKLMKKGKLRTVKEISHAIGYTNVSYFIIQFEKEYGKKPFQILKENGWR